jgi:hypothetical protein
MIKLEIAVCACCDFAAKSVQFAKRYSKDSLVVTGATGAEVVGEVAGSPG